MKPRRRGPDGRYIRKGDTEPEEVYVHELEIPEPTGPHPDPHTPPIRRGYGPLGLKWQNQEIKHTRGGWASGWRIKKTKPAT